MRYLNNISKIDVISFFLAGFASASNYLLSNEKLIHHAIVTSGASIFHSSFLLKSLFQRIESYQSHSQPIGSTCGLGDEKLIRSYFLSFSVAINVLLMASYGFSILYEGDKSPNEVKVAPFINWFAVIAIAAPYLLSKGIELKYPLTQIPNKKIESLHSQVVALERIRAAAENLDDPEIIAIIQTARRPQTHEPTGRSVHGATPTPIGRSLGLLYSVVARPHDAEAEVDSWSPGCSVL